MNGFSVQQVPISITQVMGPLLHVVTGARAHHDGQWQTAAAHYDAALAQLPDDVGLLQMRSRLAAEQGHHAQASAWLTHAAALAPCNAGIALELAQTLLATQEFPAALHAARRAAALEPESAAPPMMLARTHSALGEWAPAESAAQTALRLAPDWDVALLTLAHAQYEQYQWAEAEASLRSLLAAHPSHARAHHSLGWLLYRQGRLAEALALTKQAAAHVSPDPQSANREWDSLVLQNHGRILLECGELPAAMHCLQQALERSPDSPRVCLYVGIAWQELGEPEEALQWYTRSLQLSDSPQHANEPRERMASLAIKAEQFDVAHSLLAEVLQSAPERAQALSLRASLHLQQGDLASALADHRAAMAIAPGWTHLHAALGQTLANAGDTAEAKASFQAALKLDARCIPALAGLLNMAKTRADAPLKHQALELLRTQLLSEPRRASLHFGLAKYYDATKAWGKAQSHMVQANQLRKSAKAERNEAYDPRKYEAHVDALIALFTPEFFARMAHHGDPSARPVFIVGMPRSGTTLGEQIISSHPSAFGAGERSFASTGLQRLARAHGVESMNPLQALSQATPADIRSVAQWHLEQLAQLDDKAIRIVDKMPDNFSLLGWLAILFPNAHFVHCERDLRDVALSCWLTDFSRIVWANDMEHLVHRIRQYRRLMAHWHKVLPVPLYALRYERLVADQRNESQRLLQAVGLPWDERCINFFETKRLVRTASVNQVRQPMYQQAVARWQRYESMLTPVCAELADDPAYAFTHINAPVVFRPQTT